MELIQKGRVNSSLRFVLEDSNLYLHARDFASEGERRIPYLHIDPKPDRHKKVAILPLLGGPVLFILFFVLLFTISLLGEDGNTDHVVSGVIILSILFVPFGSWLLFHGIRGSYDVYSFCTADDPFFLRFNRPNPQQFEQFVTELQTRIEAHRQEYLARQNAGQLNVDSENTESRYRHLLDDLSNPN